MTQIHSLLIMSSINIKNLGRTTNVPNLAKHIIENCHLIDPAKLPEVEQLLLYLQARKTTKETEAGKGIVLHIMHTLL